MAKKYTHTKEELSQLAHSVYELRHVPNTWLIAATEWAFDKAHCAKRYDFGMWYSTAPTWISPSIVPINIYYEPTEIVQRLLKRLGHCCSVCAAINGYDSYLHDLRSFGLQCATKTPVNEFNLTHSPLCEKCSTSFFRSLDTIRRTEEELQNSFNEWLSKRMIIERRELISDKKSEVVLRFKEKTKEFDLYLNAKNATKALESLLENIASLIQSATDFQMLEEVPIKRFIEDSKEAIKRHNIENFCYDANINWPSSEDKDDGINDTTWELKSVLSEEIEVKN